MSDGTGGQGPWLRVREVSKVWSTGRRRAVEALAAVTLEVAPGETVALLGPSGCGKSTLLRLVAGLDPPTSGSIVCGDEPVTSPSRARILVFQEPSLFPWLSVAQNVALGLDIRGMGRAARRAAVLDLLSRIGLADIAHLLPHQLSLGMKQRAAVARAIALQPMMLLLDEPFAALDVQTRRKLHGFLGAARTETRASVLLATHDVEEALALADRIVLLSARPGSVKASFDVRRQGAKDTPEELSQLRVRIMCALEVEVDRAFAEQDR